MANPAISDVQRSVVDRVRVFSGSKIANIWDCYLDRDLQIDPDDFVDLCEDLERTYRIDLRPIFEAEQPVRRWWFFWTHPVARDISVGELATHVERAASSET
ncbi:hypothetical protein SH584_00505 [Sphingomonas sp. LY29]|uniref:hypothetical protein n=1 Tax=Sphingomonas sp. LY29 TaxID=3095341 RepID=UPI002D772522|nr:hypothetical protein [Sphingomonas sp. LY29]WRP25969.1 hypothetical protein SH584_00505 [Sphingomonas sp. LY29]